MTARVPPELLMVSPEVLEVSPEVASGEAELSGLELQAAVETRKVAKKASAKWGGRVRGKGVIMARA
jgi:hypothetical protein